MRLRSQPKALADEDLDDELEAWGINGEQADAWMEAAEAADEDEEEFSTCYVYPSNAPTVRVFLGCQIELVVGGAGAVYTGIPRTEVLAVCDLLGIAQTQRPDVLFGVQTMLNIVLPELNARHG